MTNNNLYPISKEGWSYLGYSVALFIVLGFLDLEFLQFFSFLLVMFFIYVYRNPERQIMALEKDGIVSPVDGKVIDIVKSDNKINITIDSSYHDVSLLRVPAGATLKSKKEFKGASLSKNSLKSELLNEKLILEFEDSKKRVIEVAHISNLNFAGISHDLIESQKLIQGTRYGMMLKGTTKISLPKDSKINLIVGSEVKACESIIGYLS
jgi:phosphatidylserine decarboxylase